MMRSFHFMSNFGFDTENVKFIDVDEICSLRCNENCFQCFCQSLDLVLKT